MTILHIIRHGRTAENANKVFQGQGGSALDAVGRAQAERVAARVRGLSPEVLVSSDLERARETAEAIGAACGLEGPELRPALREVDVGAWTGKSFEVVQREHAGEWDAWCAGLDVRRGGGETYTELADRIERAVRDVARDFAGRRVVVVSHGAAIRALVMRVLGLSYKDAFSTLGAVTNTAITSLDATDTLRLLRYNDAAHLEGADLG